MRKGMGHTAVLATEVSSVTLQNWQCGAKENQCAPFSKIVDTKTSIIQIKTNILIVR